MPESLRLELLRKGLHLLLDPVFYQQLEAAAGVWKVIADEDLLAGLPGWKRETAGTRVTPCLPTAEKGLEKAGFLRAKKVLTPTTSQAAAAKQTSRWTRRSSGRAVLRATAPGPGELHPQTPRVCSQIPVSATPHATHRAGWLLRFFKPQMMSTDLKY